LIIVSATPRSAARKYGTEKIVDKGGVTHYIAIAVRFQITILTKFSKKMPASCPASIELAK